MLRILIVDDSPVSRMMARRCVDACAIPEHEFVFAGDGAQALELIEGGGIDVMFTDFNMPTMDGLELMRAIEEAHLLRPRLIAMMTSTVSTELKVELHRHQVHFVISKPLTTGEFARVFAGR